MNLDPLSFTLSQISYLVASLTKKNCKQVVADLSKLVTLHGLEADRHLLQCLFSSVDFSDPISKISAPSVQSQVLLDHCSSILNKPSLLTSVCYITDHPLVNHKTLKFEQQFFQQLSKCLRLSAVQEVVFALALRHSSHPEVATLAQNHLRTCVPALVQSYIDTEGSSSQHEGGLHETTPEVLHLILSSILKSPKEVGLTNESHTTFLNTLQKDFPKELVPVVLAPLVYPEQCELAPEMSSEGPGLSGVMLETSLADLLSEIGYNFTASIEECRNNLVKLGGRDISAVTVARMLSVMCRTHSGLDESLNIQTPGSFNKATDSRTSWNVEVFVQALKEVVPNFQWNHVVSELDHGDFIIKDRQGLILLISALRQGLQSLGFHPETFPIDHFYKRWTNVEGQCSLMQNILKNSDVFCFADYPCISVSVEVLKTPPEQDSKELANWRSLNLVELLLNISECGLYNHIQELFKFPVHNCPDVLVLALLQISGPITLLRQELLTTLIPIFLGNHPNSAIILHHAWHTQNINIKPIIMHAMAEWYVRGECDHQTRLSRILDVAQDLKALSMLLNAQSAQSYPFIIDLACLASRREYLKLEKWLSDKIREHGEGFVMACIKFLHRRCPQIMGKADDAMSKGAPFPNETLTTMMLCLQNCNSVSPECQEAIRTINNSYTILLKARQPTILRSRGVEGQFNPSAIAGQLYNHSSVEPMPSLSTNLANMNLAGPTSSAFNLPGGLGPLVSSPGSPSRILGAGPSNSPFQMLPMQHQPVGSNSSLVLSVNQMSNLGRLGPNQTAIDKRIPENNLFPDLSPNVSKDIEDEANSYFQRIYNHPPHPTLSIDEVLDMLKKFQDSINKREREVFSCMLRNLFEEYKFFPQYPDKELHITAQLFGGIIERGIVTSYVTLGLALRFVLEALKKPEGSKMYYFGIAALDRFKSRLKEYHKYCEHVRAIPHFTEFPAHLQEYVEYGLQSMEPPNKPQGPVLPASLATMLAPPNTPVTQVYKSNSSITSTVGSKTSTTTHSTLGSRPSIANATNIDTLLVATEKEEKVIAPPETLQDKTAFIFNNLSQLNLKSKCDELKDLVSDEYWPWISQYLVMKRASIELNFHVLYTNFLDTLNMNEVYRMVTNETFRNIKVLLRSDKGIANFSDRSLLKNLGHWLGMLTLARNKPILQIDIDLKSLLVEAYHKGQQELLYVVPFVAKVIESCAKSKVFKAPNPWTMAIMNVLAELHQEQDLKLNLKFEIEVLCKNLEIDVSQLKPTVYLKDPERLRKLEYQLSQPSKKENTVSSSSQGSVQTSSLNEPELGNIIPGQAASSPVVHNNSTTPTSALAAPPEPRFNYSDIQIAGNAAFQSYVVISPSIMLFQTHPQLKSLVRTSIERAVQEWIAPVVDRSIKIALQTCEQIVRKDFALDQDENKMRLGAHYMVRNLSAGMAMITCRDQLLAAINTNLKQSLTNSLGSPTVQQKEMIDQAASIVAADNMELACAFVQKTAVEKAIPEIDKRLMNEYDLRKIARSEGRRYCDPVALTYQTERMPEQIRLKVTGVTIGQMAVYEEFARNIPGFLPNERDSNLFMQKQNLTPIEPQPHPTTPFQMPTIPSDDMTLLFEKLAVEAEQFVQATTGQPQYSAMSNNMHILRDCVMHTLRNREIATPQAIVQKSVECLQDCLSSTLNDTDSVVMRFKEIVIRILKTMQDPRVYGQQWTNKLVTRFITECREEFRYNIDAVDTLIKAGLVNVPHYDLALSQFMDNGSNYVAVTFGMQLVQLYLIEDRGNQIVSENDLSNTIEMLAKIQQHTRQPPEGLGNIIEILRQNHETPFFGDHAPVGPTVHIHNGILQVRSPYTEDPPGLVEKTDFLLRDWINIYNAQPQGRDSTKAFSIFVHQMNVHGILKTDDLITRFFRLSTQLCVENVYRILAEKTMTNTSMLRSKCYHTLDAFVRLVALLVKHSGDATNTTTKVHLLNKVLGIVAGCLLQDHDTRRVDFQQLPYHRIFIMLFLELNAPEPVLETISFHVLTAYCHTLHILRPAKAAAFCYAWLELVSHRIFMGRMLASTPQQKCWPLYAQLLIDLFKYLAPFLRNAELAKPVTMLYKGTLRVLLVLLHDFPEFLCDYHYGFCDVIPPNCIQMRNLILSAFPRNMRLPDPFTPNLKVDMLTEISYGPRILTNIALMITPAQFKKDLENYLKARAPVTFLSELRSNLQVSNEPGVRYYNIPLMNALVLYVGTQAIAYIRGKGHTPNMSTIAHSAHMDIFQNLAVDLDTEGRYLFLNAIANQLRYPNSHTHYFSCTLLYLFSEANSEAIQEQITRVLLERLIVNRPHPWGLLITFIELIKNPTYKFWSHEFVHCATEIEKLFESVARSCMVQKTTVQAQEGEIQE